MSSEGKKPVSQQSPHDTPQDILWANSAEVLFRADDRGRITQVNQAFTDLFGCHQEAAQGREIVDFFEPSAREELARRLKAACLGTVPQSLLPAGDGP